MSAPLMPPAPRLWCGCPDSPDNVVRDSNGVEVCGRCTGAWALRMRPGMQPKPGRR
jgi:hypothetical protein